MGSLRYSELIEWFVTAELMAIRNEMGWSRTRLGAAINKHANTIRGWEIGDRLPDKANVALICRMLQVDAARGAFLEHVIEQLHQGPGVVSDLDQRGLYIVEIAERKYGELRKWDPLLLNGLVQTEDYHMNLLAEPLDGPARKIKNWKRKQRRQEDFFQRGDRASLKTLTPAIAIAALGGLHSEEEEAQVRRLIELDSLRNCDIRVVNRPHEVLHAFDMFQAGDAQGVGPNFVYVEAIDQARHIVEPDKLALYDLAWSVLWGDAVPIGRFLDG